MSVGIYDDAHASWIYSSGWTAYSGSGPLNKTMHYTGTVGNTANFVFFGNQFTLHGYSLPQAPATAGEPLRVDLYLSARQTVPALGTGQGEYMAYARLVDDEGRLWSLPDNGQPEGFRPPPPKARAGQRRRTNQRSSIAARTARDRARPPR